MEVAQEIHVKSKEELDFTDNIGVANNKLLAKGFRFCKTR